MSEDLNKRQAAVERIGCRAAELTFDWLCGEFEDLPDKLAEDLSVNITENILWALGEGSTIDDFADAEQQVTDLRQRLQAAEEERDHFKSLADEHSLFDAETDLAFKDLDAQIADLTERAKAAEERAEKVEGALQGLVDAIPVIAGEVGRRSWAYNPTKLPRAYDAALAALKTGA